jgi:hypothetical protein
VSEQHTRANRLKLALRVALGVLVSAVTLWLAFRNVAWAKVWIIVRGAHSGLALAALASVLLATLLRSERWRWMFYPEQERLSRPYFFGAFLVGQLINALIPTRLGEVARAVLVGTGQRVSVAQGLWTAATEKVLDAIVLLLALAVVALLLPLPGWLQTAAWTLSAAIAVLLGLCVVAALNEQRSLTLLTRAAERWPWLRRLRVLRLFEALFETLRWLRQPRLALRLAGYSVAAFLALAGTNWLTARAIGMPLSLRASVLLLCVLQISAVVPLPSTPGRVGVFHSLTVLALAVFGVAQEQALSYGLILHVLVYLPIALGGPLALWLLGVSWSGLTGSLRQPPAPSA